MHVALELSGKRKLLSFEGREAREGCGCNEVDQIRTTRSAVAFTAARSCTGGAREARGGGGERREREEARRELRLFNLAVFRFPFSRFDWCSQT